MIPALVNASSRTLDRSVGPMPTGRSTLAGWFRELRLTKVTKTASDFEIVETETPLPGRGTWQPLTAQRLQLKPEGQRSWKWIMIHCTRDLVLATDEVIKRDGVPYRVMAELPYDDNDFRVYEVVNDYDARAGAEEV